MKILVEANKEARQRARDINNVMKRDNAKVKSILKTLAAAGINIQYVYADTGSYNVNITGSRADLDIMFGLLRRAGLTPVSRPKEKESEYGTKWYTEDRSFRIWIFFASTSCKRVQVGTKTVEQPVYETVCEE
jgi:hypothetical protein